MDKQTQLKEAYELHWSGDNLAALEIISSILTHHRDYLSAWQLFLQIAKKNASPNSVAKDIDWSKVDFSTVISDIRTNPESFSVWDDAKHYIQYRINKIVSEQKNSKPEVLQGSPKFREKTKPTSSYKTVPDPQAHPNIKLVTLIAFCLVFVSLVLPFGFFRFSFTEDTFIGLYDFEFYQELNLLQAWGRAEQLLTGKNKDIL